MGQLLPAAPSPSHRLFLWDDLHLPSQASKQQLAKSGQIGGQRELLCVPHFGQTTWTTVHNYWAKERTAPPRLINHTQWLQKNGLKCTWEDSIATAIHSITHGDLKELWSCHLFILNQQTTKISPRLPQWYQVLHHLYKCIKLHDIRLIHRSRNVAWGPSGSSLMGKLLVRVPDIIIVCSL